MNVVYFYLLKLLEIAIACECEAEPWSNWDDIKPCGSRSERRARICSSNWGWTLGLTCNPDENKDVYEYRNKEPCRKLLKSAVSFS